MAINKLIGMFFIAMLLLVGTVSASDWDNVKYYDDLNKEYTIENALGLGETIATVKLISDPVQRVIDRGEGIMQPVFYLEVNPLSDSYSTYLTEMELYHISSNMKKFDRYIEYKQVNYVVEQEVYYVEVCNNETSICSDEKRTREITREEFVNIDLSNMPKEKFILVGLTDVQRGDNVEWIPTMFGERLTEYAVWLDSFNTDLVAYYTLNSTNVDSVGGDQDLDERGAGTYTAGHIGNALDNDDLTGNGTNFNAFNFDDTENFTVCLWTEGDGSGSQGVFGMDDAYGTDVDKGIIGGGYFNSGTQWQWFINNNLIGSGEGVDDNGWQFHCIVWNGTAHKFRDGSHLAEDTGVASWNDGGVVEMVVGAYDTDGNLPWQGQIDEIGVWNREVTQSEITDLYNGGTGLTYVPSDPDVNPTITLNSPANNTNSSSSDITFNCTGQDDLIVQNVTLFIDGSTNYTETDGVNNETELYQTITGFTEGDHNWTCQAYDNATQQGTTETRTFTVDTIEPFINITNATNLITASLPINSSIGINASDTHLSDCWYYTSDNSTNVSVTCNTQNNIQWNTEGSKTIYAFANDTAGNENSTMESLLVYAYSYGQLESEDPTGEGDSVTYTMYLNMTDLDDWDTTNATFNLDSTSYSPTQTDYQNYSRFIYTHQYNDTSGNSTGLLYAWNWTFNIQNSTDLLSSGTTSTSNTTVYSMELDNCTSFGDVILNLSLKDEEGNSFVNVNGSNSSNIDIEIEVSDENYVWDFAEQWTDQNNVSVCVPNGVLNNTNYSIDFTIGFSSTNRVNEFYYLDNGTLSLTGTSFNSLTSNQIDLMDLLTADSTSFLFNYFDEDGLIVDNIIVHTFRKYIGEGVFREVERSKQNDDGNTIVHLVEEDVIYYFIISQNGEILFTSNTYTALCQTTPCEIQLEESGGFQEFDEDWDLIDNGGYSISSSSLTRDVNMTYATTSSSTMNLTVYALGDDGEYDAVGSAQQTGTSGSMNVNVPTVSGNTTFFAVVRQDGDHIDSQWIDFEEDAGLYFGNALALFLGALIILALGLMAVSEGSGTVIFLILGMVISAILGLIDYRTSAGISIIIYFVISGGIIVWKLTRRNR